MSTRITQVYNPAKAKSAVVYILKKNHNRKIEIASLMKILYYSERAYVLEYGEFITGSSLWSYPFGPVPESIYDSLGGSKRKEMGFSGLERDGDLILLKDESLEYDELNEAELEIIDKFYNKLVDLSFDDLKNHSHSAENTPEYNYGNKKSIIEIETIIEKHIKNNNIEILIEKLQDSANIDKFILKYVEFSI